MKRVGAAAAACACVVLAACDALLTEPGRQQAEIVLHFQVVEAPIGGTAAAFSRVRRVGLRLVRPDSLFRDTVVFATPSDGAVRVALTVESEERILGLGIAARLGTATQDLFRGATVVGIVPGEPVRAEIPLVPVPARLEADRDSLVFASILDTIAVSSSVLYATGDTVDGVTGLWTSADPAVVAVTPNGIAVGLTAGQTVLEARLDTLVDSVFVEVPPPPIPEIVQWTNALGGNWSDGANWSGGRAPIAGDTVQITLAGDYTVVQDEPAPTMSSLTMGNATGNQTLDGGGRALSVTQTVDVGGGGVLDLGAGATLSAPGGVTITGTGVLDLGAGGTLQTTTGITVGAGASLELRDNTTLTAPSTSVAVGATLGFGNLVTVNGPVGVGGLLRVDGGRATFNGPVTTSASTTIRVGLAGTVSRLVLTGGLVNNGTIRMDGTGQIDAGGTLLNQATASIQVSVGPAVGTALILGSLNNQGSVSIAEDLSLTTAGATHANAGSIVIGATETLGIFDADAFASTGTLDASSGGNLSMRFSGTGAGFTNGGTVTVGAATFFGLETGPFAQPTGSISGTGAMRLIGVTATLPGAVTLGTGLPAFLQLESSDLTVPLLTVPAGNQLLLQNGTLTGDLDLPGWLAVVGSATSVVSGNVTTGAAARITIEGGSLGAPTLSVPAGYTNNGITELTASQAGSNATLQTPTLTNSIGGVVQTAGTQPGTFTIVGNVTNQARFQFQHDLSVQGTFTDQGTFSTQYVGNGSALNVQGLDIFNAAFDNVRLVSVGGTLSNFSSVSFTNMDPTVVQVSVTHPGSALGALAPVGLNFSTTPTTGRYFSLTDSDGGPTFLTVTVLSSTPLTGSALSDVFNGAILTW